MQTNFFDNNFHNVRIDSVILADRLASKDRTHSTKLLSCLQHLNPSVLLKKLPLRNPCRLAWPSLTDSEKTQTQTLARACVVYLHILWWPGTQGSKIPYQEIQLSPFGKWFRFRWASKGNLKGRFLQMKPKD